MWRICYYFPYFTCILFLCFRPFPVNIYRLEVLNKTPLPWHSLDKIFVIQMYPLLYHVFKLLFVFLPRLLELECTSSKASAHIDTPPPPPHTHTHTRTTMHVLILWQWQWQWLARGCQPYLGRWWFCEWTRMWGAHCCDVLFSLFHMHFISLFSPISRQHL